MQKTTHILIVGPDPALPGEFEAALGGIKNASVVLHTVDEYRRGIEETRNRQPDLVCIEMQKDPKALRTLADEMAVIAPQTVLIGVFNQQTFGDEQAEGAYLIQALRSQVRDFLRRPISSAELGEILDRYTATHTRLAQPYGRIVSFISNKGGVGKSTMAVNAACELAKQHPNRVLLVDCSLQLGICARMLDLEPPTSMVDAARELDRLDGTLLREISARHSCGLHLLSAPQDAMEAAQISEDAVSRILGIARRSFDFVIVDTFPVLDAVALAVLDRSDVAYVVVGNNVPTTIGAERLLDVLDQVGFQRSQQRVILNRCSPPHATELKPDDVAERLGRPVDHVVRFDRQLLVAMNTGDPYALHARGLFGFGKTMKGLARDIEFNEKSPPEEWDLRANGDPEMTVEAGQL